MGASDSKLVFKQGIFKLSEPAKIPSDDRYWTGVGNFWQLVDSLMLTRIVLGTTRIN